MTRRDTLGSLHPQNHHEKSDEGTLLPQALETTKCYVSTMVLLVYKTYAGNRQITQFLPSLCHAIAFV
ncbi:MAG: hypothetical protein KME54_10595 [Tolypothrix brevis GSE-NOS-MK-07-07A]|nr:hypothetical protein [Tolypothrix brevis GSE-NOS-MK-07-07A]